MRLKAIRFVNLNQGINLRLISIINLNQGFILSFISMKAVVLIGVIVDPCLFRIVVQCERTRILFGMCYLLNFLDFIE